MFAQLGLGDKAKYRYSVPQPVNLGSNVTAKAVAIGVFHTCSVLNDGSMKCWGYNGYGQLGLGHTDNQSTPQAVDLGPNVHRQSYCSWR